MSRRSLKSSGGGGTLASGKKRIQEKLKTIDEEKDALIVSITSFVEKAKDAGTQLLQVNNRNDFFNHYKSVTEQLQNCIESLYLLQTTLIEGSDDEEEEQASDLEDAGEPTSRICSGAESRRDRVAVTTSSPSYFSEGIKRALGDVSSISASTHSLSLNRDHTLDGMTSPAPSKEASEVPRYIHLENNVFSQQWQSNSPKSQKISTSPEEENQSVELQNRSEPKKSLSSCEEFKPRVAIQNSPAALQESGLCVYPRHCSSTCQEVKPVVEIPIQSSWNTALQETRHCDPPGQCSLTETVAAVVVSQDVALECSAQDLDVQLPLRSDSSQESKSPVEFSDVPDLNIPSIKDIERIDDNLLLHCKWITCSSYQDFKPSLEPANAACKSEMGKFHLSSSGISPFDDIECQNSPFPLHNETVSCGQRLEPSVEPKSETVTRRVSSPDVSPNKLKDSQRYEENVSISPVESCFVQSVGLTGTLPQTSDNNFTYIRKSELSVSLPQMVRQSGSSPRDSEISNIPLPFANSNHELFPKESVLEAVDLDDFYSISSRSVQAEGACSSSRSSFHSALCPDSAEQSFGSEEGSVREDLCCRSRQSVDSTADAASIIANRNLRHSAVDLRGSTQDGGDGYDRGDSVVAKLASGFEPSSQNAVDNSCGESLDLRDAAKEGKLSSHYTKSAIQDSIVSYLQEKFDSVVKSVEDLSGKSIPIEGTDDSSKSSHYQSASSLNVADDEDQTYFSDDEVASEDAVSVICTGRSLLPSESTASNTLTPDPASDSTLICYLGDGLDTTVLEIPESNESTEPSEQRVENCFISSPYIPIGQQVTARMAHISSPSDFYLQLCKDLDLLVYISNSLRVEKCLPNRMGPQLIENMPCLILMEDKDSYARGKITQICSDEVVEITYLDFGKHCRVSVSDVFELDLSSSVARFPALAIHCCLQGVEPIGTNWSEEAVVKFKNMGQLRDSFAAVFHDSLVDGKQLVDLSVLFNVHTFDVATYMIAGDWAKKSNPASTTSRTEASSRSSDSTQLVPWALNNFPTILDLNLDTSRTDSRVSSPSLSLISDCSGSSSMGRKHAENSSEEHQDCGSSKYHWKADVHPCEVVPDEQDRMNIMISVIVSPDEFYANVASDFSQILDDLQREMNDYYKGHRVPSVREELVTVGSCWCTQYAIDKSWYRVRVVEVTQTTENGRIENRYKIQYLDYGNIEDVGLMDLRPLTLEFTRISAFATRFCLALIRPVDGASWSEESVRRFKELTGFDKMLIAELDEDQNSRSGLSVFLYNSEDTKGRTLNNILVEEKLAGVVELSGLSAPIEELVEQVVVTREELSIVANGLQNGHNHTKEDDLDQWDPMTSDFYNLRNNYAVDIDDAGVATIGYKARDEQNICHYFSKNGRCKDGDYCRFLHIRHTLDGITRDQVPEYIQRNELQLPSEDDFVHVQISAIFNPSHFYVLFPVGTKHASKHDEIVEELLAQEGDELNELLDEMSDYYSRNTHSEDLTSIPALGSLVAVLSAKDDHWYRGRVCLVEEESQKVKVFFIDSGHRELLPRRNVRKLQPRFCNLPSQAVECFMDILPAEGDTWSEESRRYFKELTGGKMLLAKVITFSKTCLTVDLYIRLSDGLESNIVSLLKAKKLAIVPKKREEFPVQDSENRIVFIPG